MDNKEQAIDLMMAEIKNKIVTMRIMAWSLEPFPKDIARKSVRDVVDAILFEIKNGYMNNPEFNSRDLVSRLYYCEGFLAGLGLGDK